MNFRVERMNSLLKREISKIILDEIDFGDSLVTITDAQTSGNIFYSKILFTVIPQKKEKDILFVLKRNIFSIQKRLNKRLRIRPVPKISFKIDDGTKNLYEVDRLHSKKEK